MRNRKFFRENFGSVKTAYNMLPKNLKLVPSSRRTRERIRRLAQKMGEGLERWQISDKSKLQMLAESLLKKLRLGKEFLGFSMVCIGNVVFGKDFYTVPFNKRLLLLPHCLRNRKRCVGKYDEIQLLCGGCGACFLGKVKKEAETLGYKVLIAEGTPIVVRVLAESNIEGVLGVSCLDSMEKSFEKLQRGGMPAIGVPLLIDGCKDTRVDENEVLESLRKRVRKNVRERRDLLDRLADSVFQSALQFYPKPGNDVEKVTMDYITQGGKRFRPFLVVAMFSLLSNADEIPDYVYKIALAIEMFHKASLVHDDIEDDTDFRYGKPALHRQYGLPIALNTGDFLVGLGYRMIIESAQTMTTSKMMRILGILFRAHSNLPLGQGAELLWRKGELNSLTPENVHTNYILKTGEAFRASILTGALLGNANKSILDLLDDFSLHFGIAFQLHDDLEDFEQNRDKAAARLTVESIHKVIPLVILAYALDSLSPSEKRLLSGIILKNKINHKNAKTLLHYITKTGAVQKTRNKLREELKACQNILERMESKPMANFLKKLLRRALQ